MKSIAGNGTKQMDFEAIFEAKLATLHEDGNYRVFAELEREAGNFPKAKRFVDGHTQDVTVLVFQ